MKRKTFSSVLRHVWAPMDRPRTEVSLLKGLGADPVADLVAYRSLLAGWKDYLEHYNDGRPVVFIGHSQGPAMLIRLLASQVDVNQTLRRKMVSAILLGGNVSVPTGGIVGGSFKHLALCTTPGEPSCIIAYSSSPSEPPAGALFGRPGQGVSLQSDQTGKAGMQVACVNPAAPARSSGDLSSWFLASSSRPPPPAVRTRWVSYPGLYAVSCRSAGGATWLWVHDVAVHGDARPVVSEALGPDWGFHLEDVNLALGNLIDDVRHQEQAYLSREVR